MKAVVNDPVKIASLGIAAFATLGAGYHDLLTDEMPAEIVQFGLSVVARAAARRLGFRPTTFDLTDRDIYRSRGDPVD